jgi:Helix-turn-helix domain
LTLGGVVLTVNGDGDVVERQLAGGELVCPGCGGVLGGWGSAAERRVRVLDGPFTVLRPRRSRCRSCRVTHVLLPAWCLLRRADAAAVVGAALAAAAAGGGFRVIARRLGRPPETVRGWLRRFASRAEEVRVFFTVLLARTAPDPVMPAGAGSAVAAAVSAVAGAAAAVCLRWPQLGQVPVWTAASAASGGMLLAPGWPGGGRNAS